ncbi:MAG: endonuclease/exonuclease/phosphatase family protein [Cyclobacteriaceae bacterium]
MTYNIRYDNPDDGEHAWPQRKEWLSQWLLEEKVDILGIQEGLKHQVAYLEEELDQFDSYGVGRDDGKAKGEFCTIFYRSKRFEPLKQSTFWLSETPGSVSTGWDAALPRIASWLILKDKESGHEFLVVNTHFDHRGEQARRESAKLLLQKIPVIADGRQVVVMGDFNASPSTDAYRSLTNANFVLQDAQDESLRSLGPDRTFSGFKVSESPTGDRIDHIFVSQQIEVRTHTIFDNHRDGKYPSDHLPVVAELQIE